VKELDQPTLQLVRRLDREQPRLKKRFPGLRLIVVWVDGTKQKLARWAEKHKLTHVTLGVIAPDARHLDLWRIPRTAVSTTVFMRHTTPVASFLNLTPAKFDELNDEIEKHFHHIKRPADGSRKQTP